jgi:hypothetical protein
MPADGRDDLVLDPGVFEVDVGPDTVCAEERERIVE